MQALTITRAKRVTVFREGDMWRISVLREGDPPDLFEIMILGDPELVDLAYLAARETKGG